LDPPADQFRVPSLSVASFNAHAGLGPHRRRFDVVAAIKALDADVVGVQETWRDDEGSSMMEDAAEAGGYELIAVDLRRLAIGGRDGLLVPRRGRTADGWWGMALLTRVAVRGHHLINLGRIPTDHTWRAAIVADLEVGGLRVVVTHPSPRVPLAAVQLLRLKRALAPSVGPTVILGDMNLWAPTVGLCFPGWSRPVRGRTWPAHRPLFQLDQVLVSPGYRTTNGEVLDETPSDHRPVRAEIEW
jgi:endonuclease/exonuclease/phosphatase family metal-dependent hydrolase